MIYKAFMASLFTLDVSGSLLAVAFGIIIFYLGLGMWWFFIAVLIDFLVLSALATHAKEDAKSTLKGYEKTRSWKNVVANGLIPVIMVALYFASQTYWSFGPQYAQIMVFAFVASVAAITADKFASEFGVLGDQEPKDILTSKKVRRGTSGGITWFGSLVGLAGASLIGLTVFALGGSVVVFAAVVVGGVFGNLIDSLLGHFEEMKIGNKYTSNLVCSAAGAIFCGAMLLLLPLNLLL